MKLYLILAALSFSASSLGSVAASSQVFGRKPIALVSKPLTIREGVPVESSATSAALRVRGGGDVWGLPISKKNVVTFWIVYHLMVGSMMPAVEKLPVIFKHCPVPDVKPGSLIEFSYDSTASTCLGLAVMMYFSIFKPMTSVPTIIAYSSLPCCYVFWKCFLKDTCRKLGMPKGFGLLNVAIFLGFYYVLYSGDMDAKLAAKLFCFGVTAMGVVGSIQPLTMTKALFGKSASIGAGSLKSAVIWMYRAFLMWGFGAYSLLLGKDAMKTVGRLAILYGALSLDASHGKKDTLECGVPQSFAASFAVLGLIVGLAILTN